MPTVNIKLPPELRSASLEDRQQVIDQLRKALDIPLPIDPKDKVEGRSMWESSDDPLITKLEDDFYSELDEVAQEALAEVIALLDLPVDNLQKAKGDKNRIVDWINKIRRKSSALKKIFKRGSNDSASMIKKIDDLLRYKFKLLDKLAEKYIVRSSLVGHLRSKVNEALDISMIDKLPDTLKMAIKEPFPMEIWDQQEQIEIVSLSPLEISSMEHAILSAADKVTQIADNHRAGVKQIVIQSLKERWGVNKLSQALFDVYSDQNRDWRRVAITELAMATNDAYIASLKQGDVVRVANVPGSCKHCQKILEGKTFIVSESPEADGNTHVWAGKSNVGRKAADWWACAPLHPNCRHRWIKVYNRRGGENSEKNR
ncbi:hypothetical protein [Paenibacillus nuruki]|uniref:hypothetical protein n=1 Tax=Paenibacillus nuruki TaxID=1886670 RepID=UPI00280551B6|nr:hypothetical protein [Paenibacillus nuruki]CAJ1315924.1 Phage-Mu-F domain-containing protein [Paenibacillus nuruki]